MGLNCYDWRLFSKQEGQWTKQFGKDLREIHQPSCAVGSHQHHASGPETVRQCICQTSVPRMTVRLWWWGCWVQLQLVASSGSATARPQGRLDWRPTQTVRGLKARHWGLSDCRVEKKEPDFCQDRHPDMTELQPIKTSYTGSQYSNILG